MMKAYTIILIALISLPCFGQDAISLHGFRVGDSITRESIGNIESVDLSSTGEHALWDLTAMELSGDEETLRYISLPDRPNVVTCLTGSGRHYYRQRNDSILLAGYENPELLVTYNRAEQLLLPPSPVGATAIGLFQGRATYGEHLSMHVYGSYRNSVEGSGVLLLPSGDTLRHVTMVTTRKVTAVKPYNPTEQTEEMLQAADSLNAQLLADTCLTETCLSRWYAAGYRYPIVEMVAVGPKGSPAFYSQATFCSPSSQLMLDDEDNAQERARLLEEDMAAACSEYDADSSGAVDAEENTIINNAMVQVSGSQVSVSFDLLADADVRIQVCDITGIIYRQQMLHGEAGTSFQTAVDCSGLRRGQYVVYIEATGEKQCYQIRL